jgi:hypothetical protein
MMPCGLVTIRLAVLPNVRGVEDTTALVWFIASMSDEGQTGVTGVTEGEADETVDKVAIVFLSFTVLNITTSAGSSLRRIFIFHENLQDIKQGTINNVCEGRANNTLMVRREA